MSKVHKKGYEIFIIRISAFQIKNEFAVMLGKFSLWVFLLGTEATFQV